jgi:hypothetical protein
MKEDERHKRELLKQNEEKMRHMERVRSQMAFILESRKKKILKQLSQKEIHLHEIKREQERSLSKK